jgi:hypothetical protein
MLPRQVKMYLFKGIGAAVNGNGVTLIRRDQFNGMAVILNPEPGLPVMEPRFP